MLRRLVVILAGLAGILFTTLPASAIMMKFVQCPGAQMKREITTPLPSGWWQTPIVAGLKSTDVQTIGGKKTLVCNYGAAGHIMQLNPTGMTCTPVSGGFQCNYPLPSPPPQPLVHKAGNINLPATFRANLDAGTVGDPGADIWYHVVNPLLKLLEPVNGASMWVGGQASQGKAGCAAGPFSTTKIPLLLVQPGAHICVKTDQGRISEMRINGYGGTTMSLSFTTWN